MQGKYTIECIKRIIAAEGGFGEKAAIDTEWNCFVNTKGNAILQYVQEKTYLKLWNTGKSHTNLHSDLHMEHQNLTGKQNLNAAKGMWEKHCWIPTWIDSQETWQMGWCRGQVGSTHWGRFWKISYSPNTVRGDKPRMIEKFTLWPQWERDQREGLSRTSWCWLEGPGETGPERYAGVNKKS